MAQQIWLLHMYDPESTKAKVNITGKVKLKNKINLMHSHTWPPVYTPLFFDISHVVIVFFLLSFLFVNMATYFVYLFLGFAQSVSDLWHKQSWMSWYIVTKSTIPNYINEVRGFGFWFGNTWLGLVTSSPFRFFVQEFVSNTFSFWLALICLVFFSRLVGCQ